MKKNGILPVDPVSFEQPVSGNKEKKSHQSSILTQYGKSGLAPPNLKF